MAAALPGFSPVPDDRVLLLGARDLDPAEERVTGNGVGRVSADAIRTREPRTAARAAIAEIARSVDGFYLHVDLDVLDPDVAQANAFPAPGGLTVGDVTATVRLAGELSSIGAAAITAYDPDHDPDGRAADAAIAIAASIIARAAGEEPPPDR